MSDLEETTRRTAEELRRMLLEVPRYRRLWLRHAGLQKPAQLSQAAVARVIADYLWESGDRRDTEMGLPRELKDRVSRALRGEVVTVGTLDWFIQAFDMNRADGDQLRARLSGLGRPPSTAEGTFRGDEQPRRHKTLSLHEFHYVGADRLPYLHRTVQVIEALSDDYIRYPYRFDTSTAVVRVVQGGNAGPVRACGGGLFAVDIELTRPLHRGETTSVVYETELAYTTPPSPEFRRAAATKVDSVDLRVEFHPAALPKRIWWAQWSSVAGPITSERLIELENDNSVENFLICLENAVVGFRWSWSL